MSSSALSCCLVRQEARQAASAQQQPDVDAVEVDVVGGALRDAFGLGPEAEETRPGLQGFSSAGWGMLGQLLDRCCAPAQQGRQVGWTPEQGLQLGVIQGHPESHGGKGLMRFQLCSLHCHRGCLAQDHGSAAAEPQPAVCPYPLCGALGTLALHSSLQHRYVLCSSSVNQGD